MLVPAGLEELAADVLPSDSRARRIANSNVIGMLRGDTGTGKASLARRLHQLGPRSGGPFVPINVTAMASGTFESALFGHMRGAFTGAVERQKGAFEAAQGGTLLIDEIGDLSLELQPKLLHAIETREITRVGSFEPVQIDVRLMFATHRDLEASVADGTFRADLYHRIHHVVLSLPTLEQSLEMIPTLVAKRFPQVTLTTRALAYLVQRRWPGNLRELLAVIERALFEGGTPQITEEVLRRVDSLHPGLASPAMRVAREKLAVEEAADALLSELEDFGEIKKLLFRRAVAMAGGNQREAARRLRISDTTVWRNVRPTVP